MIIEPNVGLDIGKYGQDRRKISHDEKSMTSFPIQNKTESFYNLEI